MPTFSDNSRPLFDEMQPGKPLNAYSILVLTDHLTHSRENSIYALSSALLRHPKVGKVHVASRGNPDNKSFFFAYTTCSVKVWPIEHDVSYDEAATRFIEGTEEVDIRDYNLIWLRLPRPIPTGFFPFLTRQVNEVRILNRPSGIVETGNKAFLLHYPQFCPPMRHCRTLREIRQMAEKYPIVLKPLEDYGGRGIVRLEDGRVYEARSNMAVDEFLPNMRRQLRHGGYLAMQYLPGVKEGDKRIIVVNGEILGAVLRMPPEGSWICNASQGGKAVPHEADEYEKAIVEALNKDLLPRGIAMYGMDTLIGLDGHRVLSEVNTLSIGGIKPLEELTGQPLVEKAAKLLMDYAEQNILEGGKA